MTKENDDDFEFEVEDDGFSIEVEDDTPSEDQNRQPLPEDLVKELEADELEDYSDKVKTRLKQLKKVWHDERREKERATREQNEAVSAAQRLLEENRQLRSTLSQGEGTLIESFKQSADMELQEARRAYKEAYESGDADRLLDANEKLNEVSNRISNLKNYKPTVQEQETEVRAETAPVNTPRLDSKTVAWQERNTWWGVDPEMTALALGLHQRLEREHGSPYIGSDEYWSSIDTTMRRRFPEYFESTEAKPARTGRASSVVAPASRSTSSKKVVLKQSQLSIAKKLGLTAEQYAREFAKMEG